MRPIRLEVEGFTCYRDRQPPLDFSDLTLFAIAGPTGAGKSSILDAMLYALYGQVPRLGKQGVTEVISHGRDSLSVCLDFEVQDRQYRVARRVKKRAKGAPQTTVTLAEVVEGVEKSLADGVRPVNEAILNVLGLSYADFIQTVILPQGEFARFLQAEPRAQREILQNLLRHGVFERMRDAAETRRRELDARLRGIDGQLETYKDATEKALAAREKELADAHGRLTAATTEKDAANAHLDKVRELHNLTKEVQELRAQRSRLDGQTDDIERARRDLENARRGAAIQPRLEALQLAEDRAARAKRDRADAAAGLKQADGTRVAAAKQWETSSAAANVCDELTVRVRRLDEIAGDIERRPVLNDALQAIPQQLKVADAELQTAREAATSVRKKVQAHETHRRKLTAERDALPFDESLYTTLEEVRDDIGHTKSLQRERDRWLTEAGEFARALEGTEREQAAAEERHRSAFERAEAAARARQSAQTALEDGRNRDRAAALRAHLHVGDSCPVCLQAVAVSPPAESAPELAALEGAYAAAEKRATEAERARQAASDALATATARAVETAKTARAAEARAAERTTALSTALERLGAAVAGAAALPGTELLDWLEDRRTDLHRIKVERDRLDEDIRRLERELAKAQLALAAAESSAATASERHDRILQEQQRVQTELSSVVARIEAVTTHPDPRAERDEIQQRITQLREAERQAREAHIQAELAARSAGERLKAANATFAEADAHVASTREIVAQALGQAGFPNMSAASAAVRTPAQQRALETQLADFDKKLASVLQRLADLEPKLAGRETSDAVLDQAQKRAVAAGTSWREADLGVSKLDGDCTRLRKAVETRNELLADRLAVQSKLTVTGELATDLRGDRFQEYLLEEAFKALVASASIRMKTISNRYTLEWESGEFYVVDHDNAGERRRAETLSGGETFMASLCLALQLSDEVLRTSGALRMDSLFIDEGFGTLDTDSLAEVTDAIEALRHDGGRLIGVISHRPELTDRLPGCIRVNKGVGESSWSLDRAG